MIVQVRHVRIPWLSSAIWQDEDNYKRSVMVGTPAALMQKIGEKFKMVNFYMTLIPRDQVGNTGIPG